MSHANFAMHLCSTNCSILYFLVGKILCDWFDVLSAVIKALSGVWLLLLHSRLVKH